MDGKSEGFGQAGMGQGLAIKVRDSGSQAGQALSIKVRVLGIHIGIMTPRSMGSTSGGSHRQVRKKV